MAQSQKVVQQHDKQHALAVLEFSNYVNFIVDEIIKEYGKSYQRAEDIKDNWRQTLEYSPAREDFLINKSKLFLHLFPTSSRDFQSPVFLKGIIGLISEYLSIYSARKGVKNRNICTAEIRDKLYSDNPHVNIEINRYVKRNEREWGLQQKRKRERIRQQQEQKANAYKAKKQYQQDVNVRIALLRAELDLQK